LPVARVRLVIAATRAERPRPAGAAVGLVRDVMRLQKRALRVAVGAGRDRPELVRVGAGEPVAQGDGTVGRDAEETQTGAARKGFADALVQLLERLLHVGEPVMPVGDGGLQEV